MITSLIASLGMIVAAIAIYGIMIIIPSKISKHLKKKARLKLK